MRALSLLLLATVLSAAEPAVPATGTQGSSPVTAPAAAAAAAAPFADGDVVAVIGDSITHDGRWHRFLADYYLTRYPTRRVTFLNCGIAGDQVGGALRRLDEDVLARKPTVALVMLGMNDVQRYAYKAGSENDAQLAAMRSAAQERYRSGMATLLQRLRAAKVRTIALTPSPFEDRATLAVENLPGANDGLAALSTTLRGLAAAEGAALVDLHGPMTALDREHQQADPKFTLVGPDRVHPGSPGHLVMAWLVLKAQGVPALVSRVQVDAAAQRVTAQGATISDAAWTPTTAKRVTFTALAQALPLPLNPDTAPARTWVPIDQDLNREEFQATGLDAGTWRLEIDGGAVGSWTATELAAGINLAPNPRNPPTRQAQGLITLAEQRRTAEQDLRAVALVEWSWLVPAKVDLADEAAASAAVEAYVAAHPGAFFRKLADTWLKVHKNREATQATITAVGEKLHEAAQPRPHRYALVKE